MEKKITILEYDRFVETINSPERVKRVMGGLKKEPPDIMNSQMAVNYSDEGYACFEVIQNLPERLVVFFIGTAS
jgi:putative heme iron utilization protein